MIHPSGLEDEGEIANVSMEFWMKIYPELPKMPLIETYSQLLTFQQGWKACKDFYNINE